MCPSNPRVLVRFVGLVQDMLDPEYYVSKVDGVYTKYRDYYSLRHESEGNENDVVGLADEMATEHMLEERQPLVIVPIPQTSEWYRNYINGQDHRKDTSTITGMGMELEEVGDADADADADAHMMNNSSRKRSLDGMEEDTSRAGNATVRSKVDLKNTKPSQAGNDSNSSNNSNNNNNNTSKSSTSTKKDCRCDWWPTGCLGSDPRQTPVLAKMYYDDDQGQGQGQDQNENENTSQPRLKMNDLVEVYGLLSMDPLGVSFDDQCVSASGNDDALPSLGLGGHQEIMQDSFFGEFDDPLSIPPPSALPRMHVLQYKTLDLDSDFKCPGTRTSAAVSVSVEGESVEADSSSSDKQLTIDTFASYLFHDDKVAAEALLLSLLSLAERNHGDGKSNSIKPGPVLMPSGTTLGCASMNFILPTPEACESLQHRICALMEQITPIVASTNLSIPSLNGVNGSGSGTDSNFLTSPAKNQANRLEPSMLQLPKSSCVVLNQGTISEGILNDNGVRTLASFSKMTRTHTVPYRFHGMMDIDFEADFRVVVLSVMNENGTTGGSKLLPCTLSMKLDSDYPNTLDVNDIPTHTIQRIRHYLSQRRGQNKSVFLSRGLLEHAQKDFVERRRRQREMTSRGNADASNDSNTIEIVEEHFHRWLTLTRLQARSRLEGIVGGPAAAIQDWDMAVQLDDKMQNAG